MKSLCMYADGSNLMVSAASQNEVETVAFIELSNFQDFYW